MKYFSNNNYKIIETKKHIFLVMEYCDGGELFDYIVKH